MRNGQNNNNKRMRGRNRSKGQNPMTRVYESNGPDVKIRGTASHVADKYMQLARDAQSSGDPVAAENYYQHAEHYFRLIAAMHEQFRQQNPYYQGDQQQRDSSYEDGDDDEGSDQPGMGASDGGYAPREPQPQPQQAYPPREPQPYMPREQRFNNNRNQQPYGGRPQHQPQPQPQPQQSQQQPVLSNGGDAGDIDQLPAFVTGGAPQQPSQAAPNGGHPQNGFESGAPDRFPLHRRRRRRHGPRPDGGPGDVPPSGPVGE
jgi:hypothetical protein